MMTAIKQIGWLVVAAVSIACSVWYFVLSSNPIKITLDRHTLTTTIDTLVTDLAVRQFNAEGQLTHFLQTPLMQHIPENNTHLLTTPHILVKEDKQPPWEIHANHATALHGGQQITFSQHVIVHQHHDKQSEETILKTEEITYFPKEKLATTLKEVTLTQAHNQMQSTGMKAYLAENRVQLLSNTRGHYEPHQS